MQERQNHHIRMITSYSHYGIKHIILVKYPLYILLMAQHINWLVYQYITSAELFSAPLQTINYSKFNQLLKKIRAISISTDSHDKKICCTISQS